MTRPPFEALAGFVEAERQRLRIPGAALGIIYEGETYTQGFGVTSVDNPLLVDADTLFQIGSISKTFAGTAAMRLVEQGKLDLDAPIRTYLPDLRLSSADLTAQVTLRHLFTHTSGWSGDYFDDFGNGDDALARYVAQMDTLPQLTPLGTLWSYNNAGFNLAGRVIEVVMGKTYEDAIKELIFDPLGMTQTSFFPAEVMTYRFSVGHYSGAAPTVARPWPIARCSNPAGAIASTANDMLRYARFHLSGGLTDSGERLLQQQTVDTMRSALFPAGNWADAVGVTFYLRDVNGTTTVGHGGSTNGFRASLEMVPARAFALISLTNGDSGSILNEKATDWALEHFLGAKAPEPTPLTLSDDELAAYAGKYEAILDRATLAVKDQQLWLSLEALGGFPTRATPPPADPFTAPMRATFTAPDHIVILDPPLEGSRAEFLRGADGKIEWFRVNGRIHRPL
ncbi:MAG TPA: serine hydrolase domain-containing protein [Phototrophicaceae bacterium]|nr:serine hydrolase domain-containing protein [Phototrophicaceae bacterium]